MKARTRRRITRSALGLAGLTAAGAWLGYNHAAILLPGWTPRKARSYKSSGAS